jgi:hypothetical protein
LMGWGRGTRLRFPRRIRTGSGHSGNGRVRRAEGRRLLRGRDKSRGHPSSFADPA